MRKALNLLYSTSGAAAVIFIFAIFGVIIAQVFCNLINKIAQLTSDAQLGLTIPSYADFSGYFLAAATALALASTFNGGVHIRVNLILINLSTKTRYLAELIITLFAALSAAYITYFTLELTLESYHFGDVSTGTTPVKIWIPQTILFVGFFILTVSFIDAFITLLRGGSPEYLGHEKKIVASE